ncbi:MAG: Fe-S cluster assembly protein SufD [Actinomycetota bacterium]
MGFSKDDVEGISAALGEPSWLLDRRYEAWDLFEKLELPGEKEEPWRYTNLARLKFKLDNFNAAGPVHQRLRAEPIDGVIFTDIATALAKHEDLVKQYLFTQIDASGHIFDALHAAIFNGGYFLYVPRGVSVEVPLELSATPGSLHNLIVVEEGAEVTLFERNTGNDDLALDNSATEIFAGQASRVSAVSLQQFGKATWQFNTIRARLDRDVTLRHLVVVLGGRFSRSEVETTMTAQGGDVQMHGLYFASAGQHFDFRTLQDHAGPHCTSDLLYKGALRDDAHTVYSGLIHVRPEGQETDAYQTNRNLVLSDHAKADSKPELEIENNDVRCSHGASVGQLNEDEIFYLVSRGIPRPEAEHLIVNGFFEEVAGRVSNEQIKATVSEAIERKMNA